MSIKHLKFVGIFFLVFTIFLAIVVMPEVVAGIFPSYWVDYSERLWPKIPEIQHRIDIYAAVVSAAGLGLVSLSLWHAITAAESQEREERYRRLLRMLDEWHSESMNKARHRWYTDGLGRISDQCIAGDLANDVFTIVNFFEKYGRLFEARALDFELTKKVFGDYALWYAENFFNEVFSSETYQSRMRAIERGKYIDYFVKSMTGKSIQAPGLSVMRASG